jgi:FimV-like protein
MLVNFIRFLVVICLFLVHVSWALTMDQALIKSHLNETLNIEIPFQLNLNDADEDPGFSFASEDRYRDFGINRPEFINKLEITIIKSSELGDTRINISSKIPISRASFILLIENQVLDQINLDAVPINLVSKDVSYGYDIQAGDTLWNIAYKNRPGDDLTMNQMMIAIYVKNIEKFNNGIDDIQKGLVDIPTRQFIEIIPKNAMFDASNIDMYKAIIDKKYELELFNANVIMDPILIIEESIINPKEKPSIDKVFNKESTSIYQDEDIETIKIIQDIEITKHSVMSDLVEEKNTIKSISENEPSDKDINNDLSTINIGSVEGENLKPVNYFSEGLNKIKFNEIINFINNFWALLVLSILLIGSFLWFLLSNFKKEKNMVMNLEKSIAMNEVATKLDLARAYVDMGDPEGAYEILEEVINHGDKSQKLAAKKLLDALDK